MTNAAHTETDSRVRVQALFEEFGTPRNYARGLEVMRFEHKAPCLFRLESGTAAVHLIDRDHGNELNVTLLGPGSVFGCLSAASLAAGRIDIRVAAQTDCEVHMLDQAQLAVASGADPVTSLSVISQLSEFTTSSLLKVGQFAFFDVRGRVSSLLIELCTLPGATQHPEGYLVKSTRKELAAMVGCSRELVGRVLSELADGGYLTLQGRKLLVHAEQSS